MPRFYLENLFGGEALNIYYGPRGFAGGVCGREMCPPPREYFLHRAPISCSNIILGTFKKQVLVLLGKRMLSYIINNCGAGGSWSFFGGGGGVGAPSPPTPPVCTLLAIPPGSMQVPLHGAWPAVALSPDFLFLFFLFA